MNILLVASPVDLMQSGHVGGVTRVIETHARILSQHANVSILAPEGSHCPPHHVIGIKGALQPSLPRLTAHAPYPIPPNGVLAAGWSYIHAHQHNYDMVINYAQDWLPFYLSGKLACTVFHYLNLPSIHPTVDQMIQQFASTHASHIAVMSKAQRHSLKLPSTCRLIPFALAEQDYPFYSEPESYLCYAGRIAPEKGVKDALQAAASCRRKLVVAGIVDDADYFDTLSQRYEKTLDYRGHLEKNALLNVIKKARAMLVPSHWLEVFGVVVLESLLCGTPVIAYRCGGPEEIVLHDQTGFLVAQGDQDALSAACQKVDRIDRHQCRVLTAERFNLSGMEQQLMHWLHAEKTH